MLRHRRWLLVASIVLVGGSLAATAGYGFHLRGDRYRRHMEESLSAFFDLPCDIHRIRPQTFASRLFEDVTVWLHDRRAEVFRCKQAVWHEATGNQTSHSLDLYSGRLSIASKAWKRDDYNHVLRGGLAHDFESIRLGEVRLHDFAVEFDPGASGTKLTCGRANGVVSLGNKQEGTVRLSAAELNGVRTIEPVQVSARFIPIPGGGGVDVREVVLSVPETPLSTLGFDAALHTKTTRGRFAGRIEYATTSDDPSLNLAGRLTDAALAELTHGLNGGPIRGRLNIAVDRARVVDRLVTHLAGRGEVHDLEIADLARLAGRPGITGQANLNIRSIDLALGHVNRLVLDGTIRNVPLEPLTRMIGQGTVTGQLQVSINALRLVDDGIEWADIEIDAIPAPGEAAGSIHRDLLINGLKRVLDFAWPATLPQSLLPEQVEYARFGVRLRVEDNRMRVLGTHGPGGDTILTLHLFGADFGLVKSLRREIDLTPFLAQLRESLHNRDPRDMGDWWRRSWGGVSPSE